MTMVKPKLTLFQMQIEQMRPDPPPFGQPRLGGPPKALDAIDVNPPTQGEYALPMVDPVVLAIAHVHQSIVAAPAVRVNDAPAVDFASDNGLQRALGRIRHDLGVDLSVALEQPEDDRFAAGPAAPLAFDPAGTKVGFVHLHRPPQRRILLTGLGDPTADRQEVPVDGVPVEASEGGHFGRLQVQGKQPQEAPKLSRRNMGPVHIAIFPRHHWLV